MSARDLVKTRKEHPKCNRCGRSHDWDLSCSRRQGVTKSVSDIHDSTTCSLGPDGQPCDQCRAANEYEEEQQRAKSDRAFLTRAIKRYDKRQRQETGSSCTCPLHQLSPDERAELFDRAIDATTAEYRAVVSVATVRAALADVLDGGCTCDSDEERHPWELDDGPDPNATEYVVTLQRERFLDAVTARIAELQAPPHNMDARLLAEVDKTTSLNEALDSQEFYELMQTYRHAGLASQDEVVAAFEAVKEFIRRAQVERVRKMLRRGGQR